MENVWTHKKVNNLKVGGEQVYKSFMFDEFQGYSRKIKTYQLTSKRTLKGIEYKEKHVGYQFDLFTRKDNNGNWLEWNQWLIEMKEIYKLDQLERLQHADLYKVGVSV